MFLAEQVTEFYPDLDDKLFISDFAVYHQRYSTNTFPTWRLAQPFRVIAHNGEINTVRGNMNWMSCHEDRMDSDVFGDNVEDIKPVIAKGSSDSAALDSVFELLLQAGRDLPMVKTMMIPQAVTPDVPSELAGLYGYCNAVMEPWDGPAAIAAFSGNWVIGGMDRNGLRPLRYTITKDGLLLAGSETGMVSIPPSNIQELGRLGPGEMIGVNLAEGRLVKDSELKSELSGRADWKSWLSKSHQLDEILAEKKDITPQRPASDIIRRRQLLAGWSMEDMELILQPMIETGKEAVGSMGDDTPLAVLSSHYRGLHHFFRQNFSQVTNPPIDSLRERHVMTLRTRLGNLGNILDESAEQCDHLLLDSPVLTNSEWAHLIEHLGAKAVVINCQFDSDGGENSLKNALEEIQILAENAVRGGCEHVMLSDSNISSSKAPIPMILAVGAVHSHLVRQQLRTFVSVNVATGECLDVHHFAVLIGVGATTVNPYGAEWAIAERKEKGLVEALSITQAVTNYKTAIELGLLKIMSKMGISVLSSYLSLIHI